MNITSPSIASQRSFSKEVTRLKTNQQVLTILVLLFICMIFWIIISLFSSQASSKITPEQLEKAKPFNPTLSTEVLDSLEGKRVLTDEELSNFTIFVIQRNEIDQTERVVELGSQQPVTLPSGTTQTAPTPVPATTPVPTTQTGNPTDTL